MNQALEDYVVVLRRWWRVLVAFPLLTLSVAALYFVVTPPRYSAQALLFVSTPRDDEQSSYVGDDYSRKRLDTFLALSKSPAIAARVIDDVGLDMDRGELIARTELAPMLGTVLLQLTTDGDTPQQAEAIGYAYIEEMRRSVAALESVSGGLVSRVELVPVQPPTVQDHAGMFPIWLILGVAGFLGLMGGALTTVLVALLDGKIRRPEDAAEASGAPVLARFRSRIAWEQSVSGPLDGESGRQLRATLDRLAVVGSKVVMVTSAERGAGKTGVALTAARVLADRGSSVAFVDFDSRHSRLASTLAIDTAQTVTALACGSGAVTGSDWNGVEVIPFGSGDADDGATADRPGVDAMVRELRGRYDWVIVDTPGASDYSDASRLARHADTVVLVARAGHTTFDDLRTVSGQLRLAGGDLAGVVVVEHDRPSRANLTDDQPITQ